MDNVLEMDEQKALVTRCHIENITIISIENSLQFPIEAFIAIVQPFVKMAALPEIERRIKKLISLLVNKRYSQGMLKGVPDLFLPQLKLFIEMKRRNGGIVSLEQQKVHKLLSDFGYTVKVCHGAKEAWESIQEERAKCYMT